MTESAAVYGDVYSPESVFTLRQAATLWAGVVDGSAEAYAKNSLGIEPILRGLINAAKSERLRGVVHTPIPARPSEFHEWTRTWSEPVPAQDDWANAKVTHAELSRYAMEDGGGGVPAFLRATVVPNAWPWGDHTTKLLDLLVAAVREHWINAVPNQPPKREVVTQWLFERGATKAEATAIDKIIRPVWAKKGGNKRRQ